MPAKKEYLGEEIRHIDIKLFDSTPIIEAYKHMSFSARELARAAEIFDMMLSDRECTTILTIAGSTSAAGCMQVYVDLVKNNMVDVVVATGASIVDMDFFEALGFKHYKGSSNVNDAELRAHYVDRMYDTFIDEEQLQDCDMVIKTIADSLESRVYSSREFIIEMGKYLQDNATKKESLVQTAYELSVPIFCPALSDSSAGLGLVHHQWDKKQHISIDSVKDFFELTKIKIKAGTTGVLMIGGGVPKNFAQDTVICAEVLGFNNVPPHKYAVQITVADVRDGALSSSTLNEAVSWGKVQEAYQQMVYSEATLSLPLLASYAYHKGSWKSRNQKRYNDWLGSLKNNSDIL